MKRLDDSILSSNSQSFYTGPTSDATLYQRYPLPAPGAYPTSPHSLTHPSNHPTNTNNNTKQYPFYFSERSSPFPGLHNNNYMVNKKPDLLVLVEEAERFYRMEKPEMTPLSTGRTPRSDSIDITTIHTQPFTEGSLPRFPAMPSSTPRHSSENKGENKGNMIGCKGGNESQLSIPVPQVNVIPLSEDTNYTDNHSKNNNTNEAKPPVATYALHNYNPFVPQPRLQNYDPSYSTAPSNATASDDDVLPPQQQQHSHKRPYTHTKPHNTSNNKKHNTQPAAAPHPLSHPHPYRRHSNSTASEADSLRGMSNTDDVAALIMQIKNNPYTSNIHSNIHTSLIPSTATNTTTTTADTTTSTSIYNHNTHTNNTNTTNTAIPKQISSTVAAAHVSPYLTSLKDQSPDLGSTSPDGPFHI